MIVRIDESDGSVALAVTVLGMVGVAVVAVLLSAALSAVHLLGTARAAADAAALAAAAASPLAGGDGQPCAAAAALAEANGARLVGCSGPDRAAGSAEPGPPWPLGVQVLVEVEPPPGAPVGLRPARVRAAAGLRPES